MMTPVHFILAFIAVIGTATATSFATWEIVEARAIAVVDLEECEPDATKEKTMVDYLERIEVKIDDVRERVVTLPQAISFPFKQEK
jgi:hypothetical protein